MIAFKKLFGSFVDDELSKSTGKGLQTQPASKFYKIKKTGTNYEVTVDITGDPPYSTCGISVNAVTGGERKLPIAARYSWKRYWKGGQEQDIQTTSNTLHVSPLDAGCYIKVYITPMEEDTIYNEVSTVVFGPIVLDPSTKRTLQGIMRAGGFKFQVERFMIVEYEDLGTDGMIMLSQSSLLLASRKNPKAPIKILLSQPMKIISQRNQFKVFILEFSDEEISREVCRLFGVPFSRNFKRLKFIMKSVNTKDLLLLSIHLFRTMMNVKDAELFNMVTEFVKDAPPTGLQTDIQRDQEMDSEDEKEQKAKNTEAAVDEETDAIDRLFMNNGMKEEIFKLYSSNQQLALQRNQLQMKIVNLESELTKSINKSQGPLEQEPANPQDLEPTFIDTNKLGVIKQKNADLSENISKIEAEIKEMQIEIDRITKIFKQMRYKELMDSKLNATSKQVPVEDISNLERALQDYASEYKKLMQKMGSREKILPESDSERSLSLVDEIEERHLDIQMKNERLKDEIQRHKDQISEIENRREAKKVGASFLGNESFLRAAPIRNEKKVEFEVKIETLDNQIQRLTLENKDLNEQIKNLRVKLEEQDDNDQEARMYNKLKHQKSELKSMLMERRAKVNDLYKTRISLSDQEMDMKASVLIIADESSKIAEMKKRKLDLERSHQLYTKEINEQKTLASKLETEYLEFMREATMLNSQKSGPSQTSSTVEKMKNNIKELEMKIAELEAATPAPATNLLVPQLNSAEKNQIETERRLNDQLMNEIIRLNEDILNTSLNRNSTLL